MFQVVIKRGFVPLVCVFGMAACATTGSAPDAKIAATQKTVKNVGRLKEKIADNLPEMTYAQYMDCSIAASLMEQVGYSKGQPPVLRRSDVWSIAADKRANPKTVSLDELLEEPKLMSLLNTMSKDGEVPDNMKAEFVSISDHCNTEFTKALSGSDVK